MACLHPHLGRSCWRTIEPWGRAMRRSGQIKVHRTNRPRPCNSANGKASLCLLYAQYLGRQYVGFSRGDALLLLAHAFTFVSCSLTPAPSPCTLVGGLQRGAWPAVTPRASRSAWSNLRSRKHAHAHSHSHSQPKPLNTSTSAHPSPAPTAPLSRARDHPAYKTLPTDQPNISQAA